MDAGLSSGLIHHGSEPFTGVASYRSAQLRTVMTCDGQR